MLNHPIPDTVTITVIPDFKAPVADAGPDQDNIVPGATVSLDGSGSSVDRRRTIKSWAWTSDTATLTGCDYRNADIRCGQS